MHFSLPCIGYRLPKALSNPLFGDREKYGKIADISDPDWICWEKNMQEIYLNTQKKGLGKFINDTGYKILKKVDLKGKHVVEIGPGSLPHIQYWNSNPAKLTFVDRRANFLDIARVKALSRDICVSTVLTSQDQARIKLPDNIADIVLSFYTLEHLHPIETYVSEIERILKPGGLLVGAIPAEGGLAWGLGRYLTSRRLIKSQYSLDPDKIICWEHPNFSDVLEKRLSTTFKTEALNFWPTKVPFPDINLIISFIYRALPTS